MTETYNEEPKKSLLDRFKEAFDRLPRVDDQLRKLRNLDKEK